MTQDQSQEVVIPSGDNNLQPATPSKTVPYDVFADRLAKKNEEVAYWKQKAEEVKTPVAPTPDDLSVVVEAIAPLLAGKGFITQEQREREELQRQLDTQVSEMEKRFDGSDGRPAFDRLQVLEHAQKTGIYNVEAAYEHLHRNELIDWYKKDGKRPPRTEKPTGSVTTEHKVSVLTRESIAKMSPAEFKQNEAAIREAMEKGELQ